MANDLDFFWWLSFCEGTKPKGSQFLGACIVPGLTMGLACQEAHRLGCNPGGEVAGFAIPQSRRHLVRDEDIGKLFSREECEALGARSENLH